MNFTVSYRRYPCGGVIENQEGEISSLGMADGRTECAWLLKTSEGQQIKVQFKTIALDSNCENSYLMIYNGKLHTSPLIGKYCQNEKPPTIQSQNNYLLVEYHAERVTSASGFRLTYESTTEGKSVLST